MQEKCCPVCSSRMSTGLADWHQECPKCSYESSYLKPAINKIIAHKNIDEHSRENGLRTLRLANFSSLLQAIKKSGKDSGKLLDVGCAHGWFLSAAKENGFDVLGIEPDEQVFNTTIQRELPIRQGFFPEILSNEEQFDIITFNDVFEHIPDPNELLTGCRNHLKHDGVLVLNLPSSKGVFYKFSRLLSKIGLNSFFERLWQKGLPSPHLHYFNLENLNELLRNNGFEPITSGRLSTLHISGLFDRIAHTGTYSLPINLCIAFFVTLALPFVWAMPSDIVYMIAKKNDKT